MMSQTLAILLDAYRELNARKMFWTVLGLNVFAVLVFAVFGANDHTMTVLWYEPFGKALDMITYKKLFSNVVVGFWFTWIATILALISTAGIFPDLMTSGSIDLYIAKPISRLRLFLTKYLAGLLFVTLQVTVFTTLSFLVLGIRAGIWEPGLFFAIPLVVLFFSYLSGICTLFGVLTRSTIAALLLTIVAWGLIFGIDFAEKYTARFVQIIDLERAGLTAQIDSVNARLNSPGANLSEEDRAKVLQWRDARVTERDEAVVPSGLATTENVLFGIKSFAPKTRETLNLMDRFLFQDKDLKDAAKLNDDLDLSAIAAETQPSASTPIEFGPGGGRGRRGMNSQAPITNIDFTLLQAKIDRERSIWWIIGTSLLVEASCLALAAWRFCTRDF